jgi:hypothetical protein
MAEGLCFIVPDCTKAGCNLIPLKAGLIFSILRFRIAGGCKLDSLTFGAFQPLARSAQIEICAWTGSNRLEAGSLIWYQQHPRGKSGKIR